VSNIRDIGSNTNLARELRKLVHPGMPFGPSQTELIKDPKAASQLFDWYNHAFADLLRGSHLIIGRRGSGKSALVRSYTATPYVLNSQAGKESRDFIKRFSLPPETLAQAPDLVVEANTPSEIFNLEYMYVDAKIIPPPEIVAEAWRRRIWLLIARRLEIVRPDTVDDAIRSVIREDVTPTVTSEEFLDRIERTVSDNAIRCVVIFDSNDEYKLTDPLQSRVFEGLCRAASNIIALRQGIDIRLCIPSELLEEMQHLLSNPGKDSFRRQYLHWTAEELYRISAARILIYLKLYAPTQFERFGDLRLMDRDSLWQFWSNFLPKTIKNDLGETEDTLIYLLRHTHMLPRQFIMILNQLWGSKTGIPDHLIFEGRASETQIKRAIAEVEVINKDAILAMYKTLYDNIVRLFDEVMPLLTRTFSYGVLHNVYNQSGARKLMASSVYPEPDFWLFRKLLFSTGAIGLVTARTDTYIKARFQFNQNRPLTANDESELCVHPLFSRTYELKPQESRLVVLPRGADYLEAHAVIQE